MPGGFADLRRAPRIDLFYGLIFTGFGYVLCLGLYAADQMFLILPLGGGFLLLAPMLAVGLYHVSARLEDRGRPTLADALRASWPARGQLAVMAFVLLLEITFGLFFRLS